MKVTVKKYLNVRVGAPSVNVPCYQYLAPGSELEVDGVLYEGDLFEDSDKWLKDAANNYYWAGGVEQKQIPVRELVNEKVRFDDILDTYTGDGVNIGVAFLDSGVNNQHPLLKNRVKYYDSLISGGSKDNISSHGNRVAGILASDDPKAKRNKSDLYCFRVSSPSINKVDKVDNHAVQLALEAIRDNATLNSSINIVNLSLDIIRLYIPTIQSLIDNLYSKKILSVVAAGENDINNNIFNLLNVIKVATFDLSNFEIYKKNGFPLKNCIYFLNYPIPSYSLTGTSLDSEIDQDSAYCAFVSAIIAKRFNKNISLDNIQNYLWGICKLITTETDVKPFTPYRS